MLRSVPLKNKPLCMITKGKEILLGDARGNILSLSHPYLCPTLLCEAPGPVSALLYHNSLYYGTWDGTVFSAQSSRKIGKNMIKALSVFKNKLIASVDMKLVIMSLELEILEEYPTESKIYCIDVVGETVYFGMGSGLISSYTDRYVPAVKSSHESSIIAMRNGVSGSTDGKLIKDGVVVYSGKEWIRAVWNEALFSSGKSVIKDGCEVFSHNDDVVGVVEIDGMIVSIGLDYSYKIYQNAISLSKEEEEELLDILNS